MSNYTQNTFFGPKDSLSSGDASKLIKGTEFDAEFSEISTAIATKYDSGNIATNTEAAALTSDTVLLTPAKFKHAIGNGSYDLAAGTTVGGTAVVDESRTLTAGNGLTGGGTLAANRTFAVGAGTGISVSADAVALSHLGLQNLTDPNADRIAFWDDSAGAFQWLTVGSNLLLSGTTLSVNTATLNHDTLAGFVAAEHVSHTSVSVTAGNGLTGGGTIDSSRTITLGTPGTLTSATTNAATSTSHTHDIGGGIVKAHDIDGGQITVVATAPTIGGNDGDIALVVA